MKKLLLPLLSLFCLATLGAQQISVVVPASSPSRPAHFNWEFESSGGGDVQIGQFACGSYWIAPANGDSAVKLISLTGNPAWTDYLSCDADPIAESHGLLDGSNNYGSYNSSENLLASLPVTITPPANSCVSLVAAMQRNEAATSPGGTSAIVGEVVDAYCVVTVMAQPPANGGADMIRPNITGTTKEFLTWDDFDLTRLPSYTFLAGKTSQQWESTRIRWSHSTEIFSMLVEKSSGNWGKYSEGGRAFRSAILIDDYASGVAQAFNDDLLAIFSSSGTLEEKKPSLAAMISYGLDIYHNRYNYGSNKRKAWSSGAGQSSGTFLPPVFAAALLEDETKANEMKKVALTSHDEDVALRGPQELRQITRGVTGVLLWGDGMPIVRTGNNLTTDEKAYWGRLTLSACFDGAINSCNANGGSKTGADPYGYIDGPPNSAGAFYMNTSAGAFRGLAAAMILMPQIRDIVNTDDPIEYADRISRHGVWTYPDPVAVPSIETQQQACNVYNSQCPGFGVTWGADPSDVRFAIEDGSGRFVSKHGDPVNLNYDSSRVASNWAQIIALYSGNTFEDNAVSLGTLAAPMILFEYGSNPKAHMKAFNPDAVIRYTVNGGTPTSSSTLYAGPIDVDPGDVVRARAFLSGMSDSPVRVKAFGSGSSGDTQAPSTPTGLAASNVGSTTVDLDWNASTDNVAVAGYKVYVNGSNPVSVGVTSVTISQLQPNTNYAFTVTAYDAAQNESSPSTAVNVQTTTGGGGSTLDIEADPNDQEIYENGGASWPGHVTVRGGGGSSGVDINAVFPFELPALGSGESITEASFSVNIEGVPGSPTGVLDLYGLDYRSTNGVSASTDYYQGSYGNDSASTALQQSFATGSSSTGIVSTSSTGEAALVAYLNAQYAAGAQAGDFVFLRLSPSVSNEANSQSWTFSSANSTTQANRPVLSVQIGVGDTQAPSAPTGLNASNEAPTTVDLSWNAATDNVGVTHYKVYVNGTPYKVFGTAITIAGLSELTAYSFAVKACDAAGNESAASSPVNTATTSSAVWVDVEADPADQEIYETGGSKWVGQANMRIGGGTSGVDINAVFPFELPILYEGEVITDAEFSVNFESIASSPLGVLDLYGLDYRTSAAVNATGDYYQGAFGNDSAATALDDAFATGSSSAGVLATDSTGAANLVDYLNDQYASGAEPGNFVFLRLNPSVADEGVSKYWEVSSANASTVADRPVLSIEISASGDTQAPSPPTGLSTVNTSPTSIELEWNAASDNVAVVGYIIYVNGGNPALVAGTEATIEGLAPGTSYTITVSALDPSGNESSPSQGLNESTDP